MRVRNLTFVALMAAASAVMAQEGNGYQFTDIVSNKATSVKNQAATGTCWCFATTSFMESELLRMGKGEYDLSEMFIVRQKYMNQLADNYLRRGRGNIGQGSISPSWMTAFQQVGIVPEEVYSGINYDSKTHNHTELEAYMSAIAGQAVKMKHRSPEYNELLNTLFDIYMGKLPETFTYNGKEYTPKSFAESLGLNMDDYVMLTSFTHKPYYERFELEIPDNWEHAKMYNLPLDEMMDATDNALKNGYTVCWDGDVSEQGYVFMPTGVAVLPADPRTDMQTIAASSSIIEEVEYVDQAMRQAGFESFTTTDDHLEHITGIATDPAGTRYYITKNSWGERGPFGGYHYMSEKYVRAKTVSILVHKDAIPSDIKAKMGL